MVYNMDFLIAAMVILLLILWDFLGQKRADDLNNQIFHPDLLHCDAA